MVLYSYKKGDEKISTLKEAGKLLFVVIILFLCENATRKLIVLNIFIRCCLITIIHECGHIFTGALIRCPQLEIGFYIKKRILMGFSLADLKKVSYKKQICFYAGGIVINCFLFFLSIILKKIHLSVWFGKYSLFEILINVVPFGETDGKKIAFCIREYCKGLSSIM